MPAKKRPKMSRAMRRLARRGATLEDIDTSCAPASPLDDVPPGPRPAMVIARSLAAEFIERFNQGCDCFRLSKKQRAALRAATGQRGMPERLLASCIPLRLQLSSELIRQWRDHWHQHRKDPDRQYMFVTIITDSGNTFSRHAFINLEAERRRADKVLRAAKLDGVFSTEVQHITNFPQRGHGGTDCWHHHCVATTNDPDFDIEAVAAELCDSGRLSNIFDMPTVKIRPITSLAQLMRCCVYMLKAPAIGKRLVPHPLIPLAWTFENVSLRSDVIVRLAEAISQVEIGQIVHSVGQGKHLLRPAIKAVRVWHKARYYRTKNRLAADFDVAELWADIRNSRTNNRYEPYVFLKKGTAPAEYDWGPIAREALEALNAKRARARGSDPKRIDSPTGTKKRPRGRKTAIERLERLR